MSIGRALVGYREDLNLSSRWWHRLLKVAFIILLIPITAVGFLFAWSTEPARSLENVNIRSDLGTFISESSTDKGLLEAFSKQPGTLGVYNHETKQIDFASDFFLIKGNCSNERFAYLDEKTGKPAQQITAHYSYTLVPVLLNDSDVLDDSLSFCWLPTEINARYIADVVRYEFRTEARLRQRVKASSLWIVTLLGTWFVSANIYFRGFIYIVCGPREKPEVASAGV